MVNTYRQILDLRLLISSSAPAIGFRNFFSFIASPWGNNPSVLCSLCCPVPGPVTPAGHQANKDLIPLFVCMDGSYLICSIGAVYTPILCIYRPVVVCPLHCSSNINNINPPHCFHINSIHLHSSSLFPRTQHQPSSLPSH